MARVIKAPPLDAERTKREILKALAETAKQAKGTLDALVEPWAHDVTFKMEGPTEVGNDAKASVTTTDGPFFWLTEGTKVRYATMGRKFSRKTRPRSFVSSPGPPSDVAFVSKKHPRPGIEKRQWTEILAATSGVQLNNQVREIAGRAWSSARIRPTIIGKKTHKFTPPTT